MMYKERFIAVIKHKGKVLRERSGVVRLPFGSEYSLMLKNLEPRKTVVNVNIDGEDILDGHSLIVQPNSEMELKGIMDGMSARNRFKFIRKTKEIANHRGDRLDDGIVRVEFKFEKKRVTEIVDTKVTLPYIIYDYKYRCPWCGNWPCTCPNWWSSSNTYTCYFTNNGGSGNLSCDSNTKGLSSNCSINNMSFTTGDLGAPLDDEGITVKGSKIKQDFVYGSTEELEESSSVIVIRLRGSKSNGTVVEKPITVKSKLECPTCGKKSKSTERFCGNCGTYLE